MGFDAGTLVEPLDWDFTTLKPCPPGLKNARGVVREPSDKQIGEFLKAQKNLIVNASEKFKSVAELGADPDPAQIMAALADLDGDDVVNLLADMAQLYSELCGGSPNVNQLLALPLRARQAFYAWINDEVVRPEAETPAGPAQVIPLNTAARG